MEVAEKLVCVHVPARNSRVRKVAVQIQVATAFRAEAKDNPAARLRPVPVFLLARRGSTLTDLGREQYVQTRAAM